jgi:hypothetical protein
MLRLQGILLLLGPHSKQSVQRKLISLTTIKVIAYLVQQDSIVIKLVWQNLKYVRLESIVKYRLKVQFNVLLELTTQLLVVQVLQIIVFHAHQADTVLRKDFLHHQVIAMQAISA